MTAFPAPRRRAAEVDLTDPFVRGELSLTRHGLRALDHHAAALLAQTRGPRRHHMEGGAARGHARNAREGSNAVIDHDELRRVASDLDRLGLRRSAARILAAIEVVPDERVAPVQDDSRQIGAIPWGLHEMLWRIYADHGHGSQSAERMAERGGFGRGELGQLAVGMYGGGRGARGRTIPLLDLYRASVASSEER